MDSIYKLKYKPITINEENDAIEITIEKTGTSVWLGIGFSFE